MRLDRKPKGFGDFFLKMPPDYKHTEETLLNQDLFTSFLQATDYSVANTRFQKQPQDLATFTDPISKQDIQMDFILVSNKWKNSIREIHTVSKHKLDTDHNPLIGRINTKFSSSAKHFRASEKPPYLLAPSAEHLQKALLEFKQLQEDSQSVSYETWMQNWIKAARNNFPLKPKEVFKSWISPETTQLMDQRTLAAARGDKETWAWLNRAVKKHARFDKRAFFLALTGPEVDDTARWRALKIHRTPFTVKSFIRVDEKGNFLPLSELADNTSRYLEEVHWQTRKWEHSSLLTDILQEDYVYDDITPLHPVPKTLNFSPEARTLHTLSIDEGPIKELEFRAALHKLRNRKAQAWDGTQTELLKDLPDLLIPELLKFFNEWWKISAFQQTLRGEQCSPFSKRETHTIFRTTGPSHLCQ